MVVVALVAAVAAATATVLVTRDGDRDPDRDRDRGSSAGRRDRTGPGFDLQDPAAAFQDIMDLTTTGQFGPLYDVLHPAQQAIINRDDYIWCAQQQLEDDPEFRDVEVHVVETYSDTIRIPGTDERDEVTALVVDAEYEGVQATDTSYLAQIDESWRWIEDDPEQYSSSCDDS